MKKLIEVILCGLMVFALNTTVQAAEYEITVCTDETTAGDLAMLEGFMGNAADGATASKALRRVAMAAVGEVCLALNARVDSSGGLTLDDGGLIALYEGDSVAAGGRDCEGLVAETGRGSVKILFKFATNPGGGPSKCLPWAIERCVDGGTNCTLMPLLGMKVRLSS
ncbi:MAG: hypothetical protein V3W51_00085 [Candidatus Brocadiales bacterium]